MCLQLYECSSIASRALHHHPQDDGDFDVITAYVMEDANSLNHENELHSGPASIKVRWTARLLRILGVLEVRIFVYTKVVFISSLNLN